ncbi:MAG TPA: MauE/DoxX family redox-associated membrane protein [Streptosporangiaceae bacterium]|nr:MauE/DoxX family redox-associated membrane protein [Streptosporangiaceae bacterium]
MTEFVLAVLGLGLGVFAASAFAKLRGRTAYLDFRSGLSATTLLPPRALPRVAAVLAAAEVLVAVALACAAALTVAGLAVASALAGSALSLAFVLTAVLAAGVAAVIRRGVTATCACFGARGARPLSAAHLARNVSLLVVVFAGLMCAPFAAGRPPAAGAALALAGGLVLSLVFIRWDDLAYLVAPAPLPGTARTSRPDRTPR